MLTLPMTSNQLLVKKIKNVFVGILANAAALYSHSSSVCPSVTRFYFPPLKMGRLLPNLNFGECRWSILQTDTPHWRLA